VRAYHAELAPHWRSRLTTRTPAERLDAAVDEVLTGHRPAVSPELDPLVDAASLVRSALAPLPAGTRFEAQLAWRLTHPGMVAWLVSRSLRHPARLLITGAVSSAVVGIGITLVAMRRGSRRHADAAPRPAHR
jgi:hypothetical protein